MRRGSARSTRHTRRSAMASRGEVSAALAAPKAQVPVLPRPGRQRGTGDRSMLDNEQYDGYFRDRCVFSRPISISRTRCSDRGLRQRRAHELLAQRVHALGGLHRGLQRHQGRLEHNCEETVYISGDGTVPGANHVGGHHHQGLSRTLARPTWCRCGPPRAGTAAATT